MTNCITVDWLQCHVQVPRRDFENLFEAVATTVKNDSGNWEVKKVQTCNIQELDNRYQLTRTGFQTRNFKAIFEIKDKATGEDIAVLAAEPRSEMCMKNDSGLIKIINKYLYQKNLIHFVESLFKDLSLRLINVTRFDIAADFLKFDTMECRQFIDLFASKYFMKKQQSKFKMMGDSWSVDKGKMTGGISSLKFGLETSDVNYYLYNKTLELQQVKDKPWIREHWASNGWDGVATVWRLEFSLHATSKGIAAVNQEGEIVHVFQFKDLSLLDNLEEIFSHLFNTYFQFVKTEKTKKGNFKKQSRCEPVILFERMYFTGVKISLSDKKDSGRSAKIFAKKLMQLNHELRGSDFNMAIAGNELFTWIIKKHDLEEWRKKKLPGTHLSDRVVDLINSGRNSELMIVAAATQQLPSIYPSAEQQAIDLANQEFDFKVSKFAIVPDGKLINYNADGGVIGYICEPF